MSSWERAGVQVAPLCAKPVAAAECGPRLFSEFHIKHCRVGAA